MSTTPPEPVGFPGCPSCAYRINGTADICGACAAQTLPAVAANHCRICSQTLAVDADCTNIICGWPLRNRGFGHVDAIAMHTGPLRSRLNDFKYQGHAGGWAAIFGRLIVGWLNENQPSTTLILGNPSNPGRQPRQHIEMMMRAAYAEDVDQLWQIDDPDNPTLIKPIDTAKSAGAGWQAKMAAAEEHAAAIEIAHPEHLDGARVLLVDDVFTTGAQFQAVSRLLLAAGARDVQGLVLARAPWQPR